MIPTRRLALLSALSGATVFAAPFLSIGDNAELYLTASTQIRYEDNVGLSQDSFKQDDLIYEVTPGFELVYGKKGNFKSNLAVYEQFVRYADLKTLDSELLNVVWDVSYNLAKLSVSAEASYRQITQNNRNTVGFATLDSRRDVLSGSTNSEYAFTEKTKASIGISYSETAYADAFFIDSQSYTIPVNYFYGISPKVDLSAGFRYSQTQVDALNQDSEDLNFNVGARGEFTAKLNGTFDVGYTVRSPELGDETGVVAVNAGLAYDYSPKTQFSLDARSGFDTNALGTSQRSYGVTLGGNTQFNESFGANASIGYELVDFDNTREDNFITIGLGLAYTINRHVSLAANYTHQNNTSNNALVEFAANTFSVSANFRY
jgi:polysaccharide biosynthesis protein VpsM